MFQTIITQSTLLIKELEQHKRLVWSFVLVLLSFALLRTGAYLFQPLPLSFAQYLALPLFCAVLAFVPWPVRSVKYVVLGGALATTLLCALYLFGAATLYSSPVVLARLKGDSYEISTSLLSKQIDRFIESDQGVSVGRLYRTIHNTTDAQEVLRGKKTRALLWGDQQQLMLSFRRDESTRPLKVAVRIGDDKRELKLSRFVPAVGFRYQPTEGGAQFVSLLLRAYESEDVIAKSYLQSAATYHSRWRTFAHLAYPYWQLGNRYLIGYLNGDPRDVAELRCAIDAYSKGAGLLQPKDNPLLRAALFSNKAVALLLLNDKKNKTRKAAKQLMIKAKEIAERSDRFGANSGIRMIAVSNYKKLVKGKKHD